MTYINPMDPPDWFKEISPTGQVPLLKVDDQVIFESLVITEFIEEISACSFHPKEVVQRANNQSWIIYSGEILGDIFGIITGEEAKFHTSKKALFDKLTKIEAIKNQEKFFNGEEFNMIDAAFAPIFMRLSWINEFTNNALSITEFKHLSVRFHHVVPYLQKSHWSSKLLSVNSHLSYQIHPYQSIQKLIITQR